MDLGETYKKSIKAVKSSKDEFCDRCVGGYCSPFNLFCLCAASVKVSWPLRALLCSCLEEMAPLLRLPPVSPSCAANMQVRWKFSLSSHWLFNCLTFAILRHVCVTFILPGDIQQHLQTMFTLLRPEDNIKLVGTHKNTKKSHWFYLTVKPQTAFCFVFSFSRRFVWRAHMLRSPATWWWSQPMVGRTRRRAWC